MDILSRYKKENQQVPQQFGVRDTAENTDDFGFLVRLVIRLSGGRIRNTAQAMTILAVASIIFIIVSLVIVVFFSGTKNESVPSDMIKKALEDTVRQSQQ